MLIPQYGEFSAAYMLVRNLKSTLGKNPDAEVGTELDALKNILAKELHYEQSMSRLLYRDAAFCLALIYSKSEDSEYAGESLEFMRGLFTGGRQKVRLASSQALGDLRIKLPGARVDFPEMADEETSWAEITEKFNVGPNAYIREGRSFLFELDDSRLLVIKTSAEKSAPGLCVEAGWMEKLATMEFPVSFHVPKPVKINDATVAKLSGGPKNEQLPSPCWYMAYVADKEYFAYPNDHRTGRGVDFEVFQAAMKKSALLLGFLAAKGIMHTALIPLFHNRVQAARREDLGSYEWHRMGRLDQWLSSCRYPNFGLSGLRDFEHFEIFSKTGNKYFLAMGSQILSLCLVAASYFRNLKPELKGLDTGGNPVDTRSLFDQDKLTGLLDKIINQYFQGLSGDKFPEHPMNLDILAVRMIEEMGVDNHMEEVVRAVDQENMAPGTFSRFLAERGYSMDEIREMKPGQKDITILTGPHLGGFNSGISLPELIDFVAISAALCSASMVR